MVVSIRGCQTCRKRRVKCDATRSGERCARCEKAARTCIWDPNDLEELHFKDENAFAQGMRRRPKKVSDKEVVTQQPIEPSASRALSQPIDGQALSYFVANFVFRPDDLPDIAHEYSTYVLLSWARAWPDSSIHAALYALSHAMYGRARQVDVALTDAEKLYASSIVQVRKEMANPSTQQDIDHLLFTIMLMGFYEVSLCRLC